MARVVIIGGGPMGLAAAHHALSRGHKVDLIEAEKALGGMAAHFDFGVYQSSGSTSSYANPTDRPWRFWMSSRLPRRFDGWKQLWASTLEESSIRGVIRSLF